MSIKLFIIDLANDSSCSRHLELTVYHSQQEEWVAVGTMDFNSNMILFAYHVQIDPSAQGYPKQFASMFRNNLAGNDVVAAFCHTRELWSRVGSGTPEMARHAETKLSACKRTCVELST